MKGINNIFFTILAIMGVEVWIITLFLVLDEFGVNVYLEKAIDIFIPVGSITWLIMVVVFVVLLIKNKLVDP